MMRFIKYFVLFQIFPVLLFADTTRVLFIGNSYTYVNDLPAMFKNLSASLGKTVFTDVSAPGGYSFEQHLTNTETINKISAGGWNYVVLQEQSQMPVIEYYRYTSTYPSARKLDSIIKSFGCNTMFFMTWGRRYGGIQCINSYCSPDFINFSHMQDSLSASYSMIANELSDALCPVGNAFRMSTYSDSSIVLWDADYSHPSLEGSYLAACLFYRKIFNSLPAGAGYTAGLPVQTALFLQNIAGNVTLSSGNIIPEKISDFKLEQNFPNPFNSATLIRFYVNVSVYLTIRIYDESGKQIETIFKGRLNKGNHKMMWKANSDLSSGVYYVRMESELNSDVRKIVLLK